MNARLFFKAIFKYIFGILLVGALVFLPAGTLCYPGGLLFVAILFIPMFFAGIVMMAKNPTLLESRLNAKENQNAQKGVLAFSGLMFIAGFVLAGLDFRFGWYPLPDYIRYIAAGIFLLAYIMYAEVMRENTWLSRTVEVREGQQVVSTGPSGVVRHPMYSATLLLFLSMPLVLGSLISFPVFLIYPILISVRIKNEEQLLEQELAGYKVYKQKVKYRLIPFIW